MNGRYCLYTLFHIIDRLNLIKSLHVRYIKAKGYLHLHFFKKKMLACSCNTERKEKN